MLENRIKELELQVAACVEALNQSQDTLRRIRIIYGDTVDHTIRSREAENLLALSNLQAVAQAHDEAVRAEERDAIADIFRCIEQPPEIIKIDDVIAMIVDLDEACDGGEE